MSVPTPEKYETFQSISETPKFSMKYIGHHRILRHKNNEILWTLGPHWPFFFCMYSIMTIASILNLIFISVKYSYPFLMSGLSFTINSIELTLYFFTAISNPGILMPKSQDIDNEISLRCPKCQAIKLKGSFHCEDCDVCIRDWDHHCVWTGKCIGRGNITFFWGFLAWSVLFLSYNLATTLGVYKEL